MSFAQGDVFFVRRGVLPDGVILVKSPAQVQGTIIAHSETGHHHVARGMQVFSNPSSPEIGYLVFKNLGGDTDALTRLPRIEHDRPVNAHRTFVLKGEGVLEYRRQREYMPEGYEARVED